MTKKQAKEEAGAQLTRAQVVRAALDVLADRGLEGVSTRAVAERLGVRMNTVLWHVKTKARMLDLMADAVLGGVDRDGLPGPAPERVRELARRYRRALLAHRDGAALVAGTYVAEPHTLAFAEEFVGGLVEAGAGEKEAVWTAWAVIYFVLGLAQEEQASPGPHDERLARALSPTEHPVLTRVIAHLETESFDERFAFGLEALLSRAVAG